ncbi:MAG TPA: hypothetical protein PKA90_14450 [Ignavibacteria bacterium]|nr:hypothetical protein [Ignavibacteria bacterium]HMR41620.1 hypothetical protein [Ignavibacteria bacterium]
MRNVKKIFTEFSKKHKRETPYLKDSNLEEEIRKEIQDFLEKDNNVLELIGILFPKKIPDDNGFVEIVNNIEPLLGYNNEVYGLKGKLIAYCFSKMEAIKVHALLTDLLADNNRDFWGMLSSLPIIFENYELSYDFASDWFIKVYEKVKLDLGGGDAFKAIVNYSCTFPKSALNIIYIYLKDRLEGPKLNLASMILGGVRSYVKENDLNELDFPTLEEKLHRSDNILERICFYASWGTTFKQLGINQEMLIQLLNEMMKGSEKEIEQSYLLLHSCLMINLENENFFKFTIAWLKKNTLNNSTSQNKHIILEMLRWMTYNLKLNSKNIDRKDLSSIFTNVIPVELENKGTWSNVQSYLMNLLDLDFDLFFENLLILNLKNNQEILRIFQDGDFDLLKHSLEGKLSLDLVINKLIFSWDKKERELGFLLFNILDFRSISYEVQNQKIDDLLLNIVFLEYQLKGFLGQKISLFLSLIEGYFNQTNESLKRDFTFELTYQSINYPGYCLDKWKAINPLSEIMKIAIANADNYFKRLAEIEKLEGNDIVPEVFMNASQLYLRDMAQKINQIVHEKSVFLKFIKKTNILYGNSWSLYSQEKISPSSGFGEFSKSMEFPRLDIMDPEGVLLKRMEAKLKLKKISKDVH